MSSNPDYAIVGECLPYISQRLLSDSSDRTGAALGTFIFGPERDNPNRVIDPDRFELLIDGVSSYSKAASGEDLSAIKSINDESSAQKVDMSSNKVTSSSSLKTIESIADTLIELLFTAEDKLTPLQLIVVDELAKLIGAISRTAWFQLRKFSGELSSGRTILGSIIDPLGLFSTSSLVQVDNFDIKVIESASKLLALFQKSQGGENKNEIKFDNLDPSEVQSLLVRLSQKLWGKRSGAILFGTGFASRLVERAINRIDSEEFSKDSAKMNKEVYSAQTVSSSIKSDMASQTAFSTTKESDRLRNARELLSGLVTSETV